jgi:hypothetical protein
MSRREQGEREPIREEERNKGTGIIDLHPKTISVDICCGWLHLLRCNAEFELQLSTNPWPNRLSTSVQKYAMLGR